MKNKKEDFVYRVISLFNIFLIVTSSIIFSILISPNVSAAQVCCQETNEGEFCKYADQTECKQGMLSAPTSCEQTTFCQTGTCVDTQNTGLCYSTMPAAKCEKDFNGRFVNSQLDQVPECKQGCCLIGSQAEFITESKCRNEISKFPELEMDFRLIESEAECIKLAKSTERGCCVADKSGSFTTRGNCNGEFFAGQFCSKIPGVQCVAANPSLGGRGNAKDTGCVDFDDSVFWFDSCGNPEGVKEKCSYFEGAICGDTDKNNEFTCERVDCSIGNKKFTVELEGYQGTPKGELVQGNVIDNGESWCVYDTEDQDFNKPGPNHDPIGSRYFNAVCINGKEFVEPCKDFRQELCLDGTMKTAFGDYTTAACLENRAVDCLSACNTANSFKQDSDDYKKALESDQECCSARDKRDCSWTGSKCIPKVSPGFKFWESEGADRCSQASLNCPVMLHCGGWNKLLGSCEPDSDANKAASWILGTVVGVAAGFFTGGAAWLAIGAAALASGTYVGVSMSNDSWEIIHGGECLTEEFLQAGNNFCRSAGDCGANVNYLGLESRKGFVSTESFGGEVKSVEFEKIGKLGDLPGKFAKYKLDWNKGNKFFDTSKKAGDENGFLSRFFWRDRPIEGVESRNIVSGGFLAAIGSVGVLGAGALTMGGGILPAVFAAQTTPLGALANGIYGLLVEKGSLFKAAGGTVERADYLSDLATKSYTPTDAVRVAAEEAAKEAKKKILDEAGKQTLAETKKKATEALAEAAARDAETAALQQARLGAEKLTEEAAEKVARDTAKQAGERMRQKVLEEGAQKTKDELVQESAKQAGENAKKEFIDKAAAEASKEATMTTGQSFLAAANTFMWVKMIYDLGNILFDGTTTLEVKTDCKPWVALNTAELGGKDKCELCNQEEYKDSQGNPKNVNAVKTCSEYRCKSLGANCKLINEGTEEQKCVSMDPHDVTPPKISAFVEGLYEGFRDIEEKGTGYRIKKEIPIYQKVMLSFKTDEPSQCKFDVKKSNKFEEMPDNFFGSASFKYFHTQEIFYPSSKNLTSEAAAILGPGNKQLFVRCADARGNSNDRDYVIEFKISDEPDVTAPEIRTTSIGNEAFLTHGTNQTSLALFVNEKAKCKWSTMPSAYDLMPADTECSTQSANSFGLYECRFESTGLGAFGKAIIGIEAKSGEHKFVYFKCKDEENNFNQEPFRLTLKGSDPLNITSIKPEGQIMTGAKMENVTLQITTEGGAKGTGESECRFTQTESDRNSPASMIRFLETNSSSHKQTFENLPSGNHNFFASCFDEAGNVDFRQTSFTLSLDTQPPILTRVYRDDTFSPAFLVLQTNEDATCQFSDEVFNFGEGSLFLFEEGKYQAVFDKDIYYLSCQDKFGNVMSLNKVQVL